MVEFFAAAKADPTQWASAAWTVYFLSGGKPRQTAPTRLLWRLAVEGSGYPDWLCGECYGAVGDLAETLSLLLPEGARGEEVSLDVWMRERLLPLPSLDEEERYARLKQWVGELPSDERLAFFKLITGELRVGVSRLQVVKALAEVAGVDEGRMAQRLIGYSQARRIPTAADFEALIGEVLHAEAEALDAGKPYPFYLAQSWSRPIADMGTTLGPPSNWIIEWKYDGIRAQLLKRGDNWRLWSRGEELISDAYPDLAPLARALPSGTAIDGELVVLIPPEHEFSGDSLDGLAIFASLQQRLGRKIVSEKTMRELPVAFIAYDLIESEGRDLRGEPQHVRRALLEAARRSSVRGGENAWRASADPHQPNGFRRNMGGACGEARAGAGASPRGADAEGARRRLRDRSPQGRRPHRRVVEMEARPDERGRRRDLCRARAWPPLGRLHGLYLRRLERGRRRPEPASWCRSPRPIRGCRTRKSARWTQSSAAPRSRPSGRCEGLTPRRSSSLASRASRRASGTEAASPSAFPRMLRWRRDKPVAEADTLDALKALLAGGRTPRVGNIS